MRQPRHFGAAGYAGVLLAAAGPNSTAILPRKGSSHSAPVLIAVRCSREGSAMPTVTRSDKEVTDANRHAYRERVGLTLKNAQPEATGRNSYTPAESRYRSLMKPLPRLKATVDLGAT